MVKNNNTIRNIFFQTLSGTLLGCIAYRTGRKLTFDGKTERFVDDDDANTYLARQGGGRKPYNIPDVV